MNINEILDPHLIVTASIGGFIFFYTLCKLLNLIGIVIPPLSETWLVGGLMTASFFITFFAPTYINRLIEHRELIHSWNPIIVFVFFLVGFIAMYLIHDRSKHGDIER